MKKILLASVFLLFISVVYAQKVVNDVNAESRPVTSFHAIHISSAFSVTITQGNEEALAVSANEKEYIQHIKTVVENGVLKIWFDEKNKWWGKNRKLRAYISVKNIDEIKGSGASDIKIEGQLSASDLKLDLYGAIDIKVSLVVNGKLSE